MKTEQIPRLCHRSNEFIKHYSDSEIETNALAWLEILRNYWTWKLEWKLNECLQLRPRSKRILEYEGDSEN